MFGHDVSRLRSYAPFPPGSRRQYRYQRRAVRKKGGSSPTLSSQHGGNMPSAHRGAQAAWLAWRQWNGKIRGLGPEPRQNGNRAPQASQWAFLRLWAVPSCTYTASVFAPTSGPNVRCGKGSGHSTDARHGLLRVDLGLVQRNNLRHRIGSGRNLERTPNDEADWTTHRR